VIRIDGLVHYADSDAIRPGNGVLRLYRGIAPAHHREFARTNEMLGLLPRHRPDCAITVTPAISRSPDCTIAATARAATATPRRDPAIREMTQTCARAS
jgi:hypothetical protein